MKINFSKILKFFLVAILDIFIIFVVQFYFNMNTNFDKFNSNLRMALFVSRDMQEQKEDIISKLKEYNKFDVVDYIDADSFDKFAEKNSELAEFVPKENFVMPAFVLVNNVKVKSFKELDRLQEELTDIDFINEVTYDKPAYNLLFKYKNLFSQYVGFFTLLFLAMTAILILKILLFTVKGLIKDIFSEVGYGILAALFAYVTLCIALIADKSNGIFVLDYHVLYVVVPVSLMIYLITKEYDVEN